MKPVKISKFKAAILVLAVAVPAVISLFLWGVYARDWDGKAALVAVRFLSLPAAVVNGSRIPLASFRQNVSGFYSASQSEPSISLITPGVSREALEDNVLERMIRSEISRQVARDNGIVLSSDDLHAEFERIRKNPADAAVVARILPALGWSDSEFEESIVWPYLLNSKLAELLGRPEAEQRLEQAYQAAVIWRLVR